MHINNSLAGRLKQDSLPVQCLTAGAATLPPIRNVFSQTLRNHYAYFHNYYAKNVMHSLRRHYSTTQLEQALVILQGFSLNLLKKRGYSCSPLQFWYGQDRHFSCCHDAVLWQASSSGPAQALD